MLIHGNSHAYLSQALINSDAARKGNNEDHRALKLSTYGIIFFGTPHNGGEHVKLGQILLQIADLFLDVNDRALKSMDPDSEFLATQTDRYTNISSDFETVFAYEVYETLVRGVQIQASRISSATVQFFPIAHTKAAII